MAGSGRRVFSPGEVLTASNTMNYLMDQTVMNFAGTAARGSAIGTAVSEGMVSYLADSNVVQAYTGSSWDSLAYASAVPAASSIGLTPVIPTGVTVASGSGSYDSTTGLVTFSAARDIDMTGIFTSTYKNYRIVINMTASGTSDIFSWFTISGTNITTFWYGGAFYVNLTGATGTANLRNNGNGGFCGYIAASVNPTNSQLEIYIDSALPKAQYDFMTYSRGAASTIFGGYGTDGNPTGFRISPATGGITLTGTMKVYGYN
jgi:hypothetical protein